MASGSFGRASRALEPGGVERGQEPKVGFGWNGVIRVERGQEPKVGFGGGTGSGAKGRIRLLTPFILRLLTPFILG
jgi:hypothetical protein